MAYVGAPRNGFIPSRHLNPDTIRRCWISAGGNFSFSKGDAVCAVNGIICPITAGQDPSQYGFGVIVAVYASGGGYGRPLQGYTNKTISSGQVGYADICFDPNQTYYVQCVTSVGMSNLYKNVMVDVSAPNQLLGISGQSVDIPASASVNDLFKVINIGPFDEVVNGAGTTQSPRHASGGPNNGVEVRWNRHFLNAPTANQ